MQKHHGRRHDPEDAVAFCEEVLASLFSCFLLGWHFSFFGMHQCLTFIQTTGIHNEYTLRWCSVLGSERQQEMTPCTEHKSSKSGM
jgi:hypothetical protein